MTTDQKLKEVLILLQNYVDAIDSAVSLANSDTKGIRKIFKQRTAKQTYESMQISPLYNKSKELLSKTKLK